MRVGSFIVAARATSSHIQHSRVMVHQIDPGEISMVDSIMIRTTYYSPNW